MDTPKLTDERLKSKLNGDQPGRERMCLAVLALDHDYRDIRPRRPEGGPDGGRDIECLRFGEPCFGAVGFVNNACDSTKQLSAIKKKFRDDVIAARAARPTVKAFVFFCNIDLTPGEVNGLVALASKRGFTFVDVYYRERIRMALDNPEGLAIRFQYLSIPLSDAEQQAFFSRFGKDLELLIRGRFDQIERKLDEIEFARWKAGHIKSVSFDVHFKQPEPSKQEAPEHFRVCFHMQGVYGDDRGIVIGGRDEYVARAGVLHFGTKTFFWRERTGPLSAHAWIPRGTTVTGGVVTGVHIRLSWPPISDILVDEFEDLNCHFHFTENLRGKIDRVIFRLDDYAFKTWEFNDSKVTNHRPTVGWPDPLSDAENTEPWRACDLGRLDMHVVPPKSGRDW